jgi:hypothetical protein
MDISFICSYQCDNQNSSTYPPVSIQPGVLQHRHITPTPLSRSRLN